METDKLSFVYCLIISKHNIDFPSQRVKILLETLSRTTGGIFYWSSTVYFPGKIFSPVLWRTEHWGFLRRYTTRLKVTVLGNDLSSKQSPGLAGSTWHLKWIPLPLINYTTKVIADILYSRIYNFVLFRIKKAAGLLTWTGLPINFNNLFKLLRNSFGQS